MTHVAAPLAISASLFLSLGWPALAANPHDSTNSTGRPTQSCGSATAPNTPGGAASAPGSAFNPDGKAGMVYAGQQPQNSGNGQAAQYDVACFQQP
jgi:hypothetical protein